MTWAKLYKPNGTQIKFEPKKLPRLGRNLYLCLATYQFILSVGMMRVNTTNSMTQVGDTVLKSTVMRKRRLEEIEKKAIKAKKKKKKKKKKKNPKQNWCH